MANDYIKNEIRANYETEDLSSLSKRLKLKKDTIRKIANRMGLSRRAIISNAIKDGLKRCNVCNEWLPLPHFTTDPGAPNGYDYRCRKCKYTKKEICPEVCQDDKNKRPEVCQEVKSMAFGVKKTRNPIILVTDENGNYVRGRKCKACKTDKPMSAFNKLHKSDPDDTDRRKNICKVCLKNKHMGII